MMSTRKLVTCGCNSEEGVHNRATNVQLIHIKMATKAKGQDQIIGYGSLLSNKNNVTYCVSLLVGLSASSVLNINLKGKLSSQKF